MTKNELKSLTFSKLNAMTESELDVIANEVVKKLSEDEIKVLPSKVRKKLKIKREGSLGSKEVWITIIIGALIMSLIQVIMGK